MATPQRVRPSKRPPVPLLLESFPAPPSHIPPTPTIPSSPFNPPPSRPPSTPLPPVPGPSRLSDHEALLLLSSVASHNRSSRSSAYSAHSAHSSTTSHHHLARSDSLASNASNGPAPSPNPRPSRASPRSTTPNASRDSVASSRSTRSIPRSPSAIGRPSIAFSISEEDDSDFHLAPAGLEQLSKISVSPLPLDDFDVPVPPLPRSRHRSIAEPINPHAHTPPAAPPASAAVDLQALHLRMRANRSRSASHKQALRARSVSPSKAPIAKLTTIPPVPPIAANNTPASSPTSPRDQRSPSPDIAAIISVTPRPYPKRKSSAPSFISRSSSRARVDSNAGIAGIGAGGGGGGPRRASEGGLSSRLAMPRSDTLSQVELPYSWVANDDSYAEDYGTPISHGPFHYEGKYVEDEEDGLEGLERLERELDGHGSDGDSDSSIDLHTPLPHVMLRDGLLSPNSKLLSQSRANTPQVSTEHRPGSVASMGAASLMTRSGVMKDDRDTPLRRVRHRDGRLLRGGIGLTTGLGWSDSEDENAPSPLTRRLSSLNLSRRSSASSVFAAHPHPHPLSRSGSSDALAPDPSRPVAKSLRSPIPPTSWQNRSAGPTSSAGSALSIDVGKKSPSASSLKRTTRSGHPTELMHSSASTLSIPLPVTPSDDAVPSRKTFIDKDKSLPPLPPHSISKYPSTLSLGGSKPFPRARTYSSTSSASSPASPAAPPSLPPSTPINHSIPTSNVRPLRLSQPAAGDRPPVPVPAVSPYSPSSFSALRPPSLTAHPTSTQQPPDAPAKPKPRTGTGMVYRSSSRTTGAMKIRPPMPLASSASTGILPPTGTRPLTSGIGRPIAL